MSVHTDYVLTMPTSLPHPPHEATPTFKDPSFLRVSIHKKFLLLCLMLISLMTISISTVYFMLTSNDKQRLSQQHIQVAFDLLLHGIVDNLERQTKSFEEFTQHNQQISKTAFLYAEQARNAKAVSPRRQCRRHPPPSWRGKFASWIKINANPFECFRASGFV